ncbi:MAG: tripartite tricarboxylate transporter permease [Hyphomicrobiales bacterium]|nr:tripartite tricarboxylate transporter permease [Hyphomicrobiales bacterium]
MLENVATAFGLFATFDNFGILLLGVLIGAIVGAIPGMTATMGVALTLPFTFHMDPVTGILLLLGVYKGGIYGGSIPAILIKTPGTPAAACTVLDGYPMAQKGQANKALHMALYASCFADFVSNISLIFFAGFIAQFALKFGPPEFFTLILFSLTIIAGVSGDSLLKGLVSAGFGLLLATIGLDLIYGTERFVFDNVELMGGVKFIPVLIGLFALPEIIDHYSHRLGHFDRVSDLGKTGVTWPEWKRCFKTIMRGSLIGVAMGAIPGIGGAPSAFLSYSEAKRTSKVRDNFGKGEIEGVAAAESGNNGVCGATMIPLLALGVPGDVITAVILGAFMIHGLQPGPILFQQNITLVYAIFMGIMLSSLYLFAVGKLGIKLLARISDVPNSFLYPTVLVLCVFGAYAVGNTMFDVLVMMIMGLVGYFMLKFDIPAAPFLIAFILGPLLEDSFRQALQLTRGDYSTFVSSGICIFFLILTVLSIAFVIKRNVDLHRQKRHAESMLME